ETVLHEVVREQLESFLASAREGDHPAPRFIEQELRAYLRCGILAHGFLRLHCDACGHDRLVPFSCRRRGFCPSCGGRRMADTAAHLVDCVLPEVPIRQWVLTLPYALRYRCAYEAALTSEVLRAFLRALFTALRRRAKRQWGIPRSQCGSVTFVQRFGSALNLNLHFHTLALDGVYTRDESNTTRFLPLPPPSPDEVARVLAGTARRITRLVALRTEDDDDALARDEPLLAVLAAASLRSRVAMGPGAGGRWRRLRDRIEPDSDEHDPEASSQVPRHRGMSLHAIVAVPARDRRRLERLCRYVARPPLAHDRLEGRPEGRLALRLKTPWRDGTTHILMERHELLERLVPLIPPP
ncbi:MAG: transposase, partial [bacterium]|nr:transposase [bacterium]